jgi:DivIVA domain-containing protein
MGTRPPTDPSSPSAVAAAAFPTARKGFDPDSVRDFLRQVAGELRRVQDERNRLAVELDDARAGHGPVELDEATVTDLLGEETAAVLRSAHEAATLVRARAEESASQRLREVEDETGRQRAEADVEVARLRQEANARAQELKDAALREGREMVNEARAVRERLFADLARRRDLARQQIEQLLAERERLERVFLEARASVDGILDELADLGPPPDLPEGAFTPPTTGEVPTVVLGEVDVPTFVAAAARVEADVDDTMARHPTHRRPHDEEDVARDGEGMGAEELADEDPAAPRPSVDDLFARLRASGTAAVAEEVLAEDEIGAADAAEEPATDVRALSATPDHPVERFEERKLVLEPVAAQLARALKRVLADEQNDVLDRLRRAKALPTVDDLLGSESDQNLRYRDAADEQLRVAAVAGVQSLGPGDPDEASQLLDGTNAIDRCLSDVDSEVVQPLRQRVATTLSSAADDPVEAASLLRGVFREWKVDRLDGTSDYLALSAHGRGAFIALAPGTPVCWVADPEGPGCPDAEDNSLAGAVAAGDEFPTGHRHAPAYPGCRCLLAPVHD